MSLLADMAKGAGISCFQEIKSVLCSECGIVIEPDIAEVSNICEDCFYIVYAGFMSQKCVVFHCYECKKYVASMAFGTARWLTMSKLRKSLGFVYKQFLKRLPVWNKVKLVQCEFIETEPDSKVINVKFTVYKEVLGTILEKSCTTKFWVIKMLCQYCPEVKVFESRPEEKVFESRPEEQFESRPEEKVFESQPEEKVSESCPELRQSVSHRRTFFHLEQLILKDNAAADCVRIKQVDQGLDFIFPSQGYAFKFVEFLASHVPIKYDLSLHGNNCALPVTICPICPDDLIYLPHEVAAGLGNFGPLVICIKVTNSIVLMNPFTLDHRILDGARYWETPFESLLTCDQLTICVTVDIGKGFGKEVTVCGKQYELGKAIVARLRDYWTNNRHFYVWSHLGGVLDEADAALGHDLALAKGKFKLDKSLPELILVKRCFVEELNHKRGEPRPWVLKRLDIEVDDKKEMKTKYEKSLEEPDYEKAVTSDYQKSLEEPLCDDEEVIMSDYQMMTEYERFLCEVETNPDIWPFYNFYKNKEYDPSKVGPGLDFGGTWPGYSDGPPSFPEEQLLDEAVQV
ncbi:OLC1v1020681C1 [Oldenlandia corymbosa var. corymbosa]|uniref:60S ribosomal export protein NMD3 n=1 Tax=Oldenlandia corymbosa var. corymbosa TaxID=529605 RepID=A0AAV1EGZ7_OLDCO|nr:OLC1v1020681C1 [Oldenlandia corymbosa var. corymbosa]